MTTWVLILTIFGGEGSAAIDHVNGFESKAVCTAAGQQWAAGIDAGWFDNRRTKFICIEVKMKVES